MFLLTLCLLRLSDCHSLPLVCIILCYSIFGQPVLYFFLSLILVPHLQEFCPVSCGTSIPPSFLNAYFLWPESFTHSGQLDYSRLWSYNDVFAEISSISSMKSHGKCIFYPVYVWFMSICYTQPYCIGQVFTLWHSYRTLTCSLTTLLYF